MAKASKIIEWSGYVTSVDVENGTFEAKLMERGCEAGTYEMADFDIKEYDIDMPEIGRIFTWAMKSELDFMGPDDKAARHIIHGWDRSRVRR